MTGEVLSILVSPCDPDVTECGLPKILGTCDVFDEFVRRCMCIRAGVDAPRMPDRKTGALGGGARYGSEDFCDRSASGDIGGSFAVPELTRGPELRRSGRRPRGGVRPICGTV